MRALAVAALVLAVSGCAATLPPAPDRPLAEPSAASAVPQDLKVCWAELSRGEGPAWPATKGPTETKTFHGTVSSLVIRHPAGDVVVDVGNSLAFRKDWADYPFVLRKKMDLAPGRMQPVVPTQREAFEKVGVDVLKMKIILSHAHADHAGGVGDLPGVPVLTAQQEIDFVASFAGKPSLHIVPAHAKGMAGRLTAVPFASGPYEAWDKSEDLFGDGSVVLVPLSGHTPGSIGTFVNLAGGRRIFHIGDAAMLGEAIEKNVPKGALVRELDWDHAAANVQVSTIHALAKKRPGLVVLPAHDRTVWEGVFAKGAGTCVP